MIPFTGGPKTAARDLAIDPEHIAWSRNQFAMIADGGVWGVPRSGLIFTRHGDSLELTACMPHDPEMPLSPDELQAQQQADFNIIKRHFEAAGISVRK